MDNAGGGCVGTVVARALRDVVEEVATDLMRVSVIHLRSAGLAAAWTGYFEYRLKFTT
jgi:hypothetical protein